MKKILFFIALTFVGACSVNIRTNIEHDVPSEKERPLTEVLPAEDK